MPQNEPRIARFGVFELDFRAGDLRKNGTKLRLQGQPFQVLALLLQRAGEVVTREELRQRLWPSDTFVDFDHSLNTAINKVREALGDSASNPRFIETLARRGYRFIAPVQGIASSESAATDTRSSESIALPAPSPRADRPALHPELEIPIPQRGVIRLLFGLIQLMYLIFYIVALFRLHAIEEIGDSFLPAWGSTALAAAVLITAGTGIPLRCYLISAVAFDYQRLGEKFRRIFLFVLALDELWAVTPFLLIRALGIGGAFAISAALLYVPFSERSLIRMTYPAANHGN
jgi:cholera toxin transcriptional activator